MVLTLVDPKSLISNISVLSTFPHLMGFIFSESGFPSEPPGNIASAYSASGAAARPAHRDLPHQLPQRAEATGATGATGDR